MVYVSNPIEMTKALSSGETVIDITRSMAFANPIYLPNGIQLSAIPQENGVLPTIFFSHSDGFILTGSSRLQNLSVVTLQDKKAIQLTSQQVAESFGTIHLENLTVDGQISLIFRTPTLKAHVVTKNVHVASSDTRTYLEQPQKYGVNVLQGAYTLYNFNANKDSLITASIDNLSIGSEGHPAIGSGVFISGFNDQAGRVDIDQMTLGDVYSTGLIPQGVADFITGAVFVVYGAHVSHLIQNGKTVTYGVNDMVLDAWGQVDEGWSMMTLSRMVNPVLVLSTLVLSTTLKPIKLFPPMVLALEPIINTMVPSKKVNLLVYKPLIMELLVFKSPKRLEN